MKILKEYSKEFILGLLMMVLLVGCSEEEEKFPTFDPPIWNVNSNPNTQNPMTAVVVLPENLIQYANENDQLAAFSGDDCRGVGEFIDGSWLVTIEGAPEDQSNIHFKYYSARNRYLYYSSELFSFEDGGVFGIVDEPEVIQFTIVKK